MVAEDLGYLISCCGFLSFLMFLLLGFKSPGPTFFFRGPLALASLDLAYFLLGLAHFFGLLSL